MLDQAGAGYRGVVLSAFPKVTDSLTLLYHYGKAAESERSTVTSAQQSLDVAMNRHPEGAELSGSGGVPDLCPERQRQALALETRHLRVGLAPIRAPGGVRAR